MSLPSIKSLVSTDPYEYRDNVEMGENTVQEVMLDLQSGNIHSYISYLKDIVDEECDLSVRAGVLMERLKAYEPELPKDMEPMVYVNYCEKSELGNPRCQKLSDLDSRTVEQDKAWYADCDPNTNEPKTTAQMFFTVYYAEKGDKMLHHFQGRIDIGSGNGGIISQLMMQNEMKLTDESWISYAGYFMSMKESIYVHYNSGAGEGVLPADAVVKNIPYNEELDTIKNKPMQSYGENPTTYEGKRGISLQDTSAEAREKQAKQLFAFAKENNISGLMQETDTSGRTSFGELNEGIYLIAQIGNVENGTDKFESAPFLVNIPSEINGNVEYNVTIEPKAEWVSSEIPPNNPDKPKDPTPSKPDKPNTIQKIINTVKTGDTTNIVAWFLIALVSLGLIIGFYKKRKMK